jgi:hypothetical protein
MKVRFAMLFALIIMMIGAGKSFAQELPGIDLAKDAAFRVHIERVVKLNPHIKDFTKMPAGTPYDLETGWDQLEVGDTRGIWGREFWKTYGYEYNPNNLRGNMLPLQISTPLASGVSREELDSILDRKLAGLTTGQAVHNHIPWWIIALLALAVLIAAVLGTWVANNAARERMLGAARFREDQERRRFEQAQRELDSSRMEQIAALQDHRDDLRKAVNAANQREARLAAMGALDSLEREFFGGKRTAENVYNGPVYNGSVYQAPTVVTGANSTANNIEATAHTNIREPVFP